MFASKNNEQITRQSPGRKQLLMQDQIPACFQWHEAVSFEGFLCFGKAEDREY